jgi:23S rRNA pseudouridine955/2504/2580 synthase
MPLVNVQHVDIDQDVGQRIDNFLLRTLSGVPRSRIYRMLRRGEVRVNGGRVTPEYRLERGDRVRLPPWRAPAADAQPVAAPGQLRRLDVAILYEDEDLIVLDKPAGIAVHGGSGVSLGVVEMMRQLRPELDRLELVHRLDRDTSGVLLLAKSRRALLPLHAAFRTSAVRKTYDVLVYGSWPKAARTMTQRLSRYLTRSGERRVRAAADGKPARTEFAVHATARDATWLRAHPHTGRTHQIRVHCLAAGHPVVGDAKYASDQQLARARELGITRLCLHARMLVLPDRQLRFEAALPASMLAAWSALGGSP